MLEKIFVEVLNISIESSIAVILIILFRWIFRNKAGRSYVYVMWVIVLIRLLAPFHLPAIFSIFNAAHISKTIMIQKTQNIHNASFDTNYKNMPQQATYSKLSNNNNNTNNSLPKSSIDFQQQLLSAISWIWFLCALAFLLFCILVYLQIYKKFKEAILFNHNSLISECTQRLKLNRNIKIYFSDQTQTPLVCGIITPRIILPLDISKICNHSELKYIITHELVHIKRFDYLIKPLFTLALCLHWFNPIIWLAFIFFQNDIEISCDEKVLSLFDYDIRSEYALSLIKLAENQHKTISSGFLAFGKSNLKNRVKAIVKFKKSSLLLTTLGILGIIVLSFVLLINSQHQMTDKSIKATSQDERLIQNAISNYYLKSEPDNYGTLKIYNIKKYNNSYLCLSEKYRGEGQRYSDLFLIDSNFNIKAKAPGNIPISPCFSANVVKYDGKSIVYGNFKNKKWDPKTGIVSDVEINTIKITFEDGTVIQEPVSMEKGYIVVANTISKIKNIEVYNSKGKIQSNLINDSFCEEFKFQKVYQQSNSASGTDTGNVNLIKIEFDANNNNTIANIKITNGKIINDILSMIKTSQKVNNTEDITRTNVAKGNIIYVYQNGSERRIRFLFDDLYQTGYLEDGKNYLKPNYDFFRYIESLYEYQKYDTNIEEDALTLFYKYKWTIDFKINTLKERLPATLKHKAWEYPVKLYWAYNNELSKHIGFDMTSYLGKDVTVEIYRLREPLPDFMKPRMDARGIVVRYNNIIVGAYIDAGRHSSFACSLDRKSLYQITKKSWNKWIENYIDFNDNIETYLAKLTPEEVIKTYFEALSKNDLKMIHACTTRENLIELLSINMNNYYLYNSEDSEDYNIKSAKLLKLEKVKPIDNSKDTLEYLATIDFDYKRVMVEDDGVHPRFIILKKEVPKLGWRISGIGTGP